MDYQTAQKQIQDSQKLAQDTLGKVQAFSQKLAGAAPDANTARDWGMDLRDLTLSIQQLNQQSLALLGQMGQYIQTLEGELQTHPTTQLQQRGWGGGGGFLSSMTSGLGMGVGFAAAEDVVGSLLGGL
jgi:hypothetical protein